jgi:rubrerythrin
MTQISKTELQLLSNYAASELAGALILGNWARKTKDASLRAKLTWHCAEEARHAALLTETITSLGLLPLEVHDQAKGHYYAQTGEMKNEIELLAFLNSFERLVPFHYTVHMMRPGIHEKVKQTLTTMIKDEVAHISWTRDRLNEYTKEGKAHEVEAALAKFEALIKKVYTDEISQMQKGGLELKEFAELILKKLPPQYAL